MATTEERLAALEAKMAQLTATTPTTYYTHQYSGEEIDAAVGRAMTGGALDTSVGNVSKELGTFVRPNLLDNWYFGRPVNQRGQTEYTGKWYTVDRWRSESDDITTKVISGGITISTTAESGATELREYLEYVIPAGTMITISAIVSKTAASKNGVVRVAYTDNQVGLQANLPDRAMDYELVTVSRKATADVKAFVFRASNGDGYTVHAAKLELGSTQTLAHLENGNWVLNEIPDYGEQLRKCQRYFLKIGDALRYCSLGTGLARDGQFVSLTIPTPVTMRTVLGLAAIPIGFVMRHADTKMSGGSNFYIDAFSQNSIILNVQSQVSLTAGEAWEAFLQPGGSLMISADL